MWVDDDIFPHKYNANFEDYTKIQKEAFDKNINFILKSNSSSAMAYIESILFKASLEGCNYFKLITDVYRTNENTEQEKKYAGPNFIKRFVDYTKDFENIQKVEKLIYCGSKKVA